MKKYLAIFAHYDKDQIIDDYVILYLQGLQAITKDIIFVSDGEISDIEKKKLDGICEIIIAQKHGEYDFGSWKRGLKTIGDNNLEKYDDIILANDSCYLISSLVPVFQEMEKRNSCDFWGIAKSKQYGVEHIHSYFMVFNRKIFVSEVFKNFFDSIKKEEKKIDVIKNYEIVLTKHLRKVGFIDDCFLKRMICSHALASKELSEYMLPRGFPFLKIRTFFSGFSPEDFKDFLDENLKEIISQNLFRRIGLKELLEINAASYFHKKFIHRKIFLLVIKRKKLTIKIFGIKVATIKIR